MKTFVILLFISSVSYAGECKLKGMTQKDQTIETSFQTADADSCKTLAEETKSNNFYSLVEKDDQLIGTSMKFKEEEVTIEAISFEDESNL